MKIVSTNKIIPYQQSSKAPQVGRLITVSVEYWATDTAANSDLSFRFIISSAVAAVGSAPTVGTIFPFIPKDSFTTVHKTMSFDVPIVIHATNTYTPEFFTIGLSLPTSAATTLIPNNVGVYIQEKVPEEKKEVVSAVTTPIGFTYLNAVNFDFENSSGAAYVGHLNIFKHDALRSRKKPGTNRWYGLNCGIMKINYSKGGDSINSTQYISEVSKINPLDPVKVGMVYHRQFNEFKNVSKNTSWSFYFQPTYTLYNTEKLKILVHAHAEFFVNTWSSSTKISNIQEVNDTLKTTTSYADTANMLVLDRFYKKSEKAVTLTSSSTKLIFFYGLGLTLYPKLWDGGYLFVQTTFGRATAYLSPEKLLSDDLKEGKSSSKEKNKAWFHMVRIEYTQQLTGSLQSVVGFNVRGRFEDDPVYAGYIGVNLGLAAIKKMFDK